MTRLWLDDLRPAPDGWTWARSVNAARRITLLLPIEYMSLDHDLGDYAHDGGDGTEFTDWLAATDHWPTHGLRVHSSNPVGIATMLATVDRYSALAGRSGATRGQSPPDGWPPALVS